MKNYHHQNYYELLDIQVNASQDEILNAYKRARATYGGNSPALYSVFSKQEAESLLKMVDEAYAVLSNQYKRKEYNKKHFPHLQEAPRPAAPAPVSRLVAKGNPFVAARQTTADLIPVDGLKNVSVKKSLEPAPSPGTTKFGKYEVREDMESEIKTCEHFSGAVLSKIRIYKNISLDQLAAATKINRPYLSALEADDYSNLPASVFLRGFLVQVAKVLGLDIEKVTSSYLKLFSARDTKR